MSKTADVDFRPEKPAFAPPPPPPHGSVRLLGSLTIPDGRTLLNAPTISWETSLETQESQALVQSDWVKYRKEENVTIKPSNRTSKSFLLPVDNPLDGFPTFENRPSFENSTNRHESQPDSTLSKSKRPDNATFSSRYSDLFKEDSVLPAVLPEIPLRSPALSEEEWAEEKTWSRADFSLPELPETWHHVPDSTNVLNAPPTSEIRKEPKTESEWSGTLATLRLPQTLRPIRPYRGAPFRSHLKEASTAFSLKTASYTTERTGKEMLYVHDLHKSYSKAKLKIPVLKGTNLSVMPGEFVSIIGQSGSGKSTFLHLLGTLDKADSGEIYFEDKRIDNLPQRQRDALRNRSFGFVFQFYHLLPELTTLENVLAPLMVRDRVFSYLKNRKNYKMKALERLEQVGLSHRINHKPRELSGGEMQRTAIARAIVAQPKILLADEPTGNLDATSAHEIIELLQTISQETNLTILMVTHDSEIAKAADRTVRMIDGMIVV